MQKAKGEKPMTNGQTAALLQAVKEIVKKAESKKKAVQSINRIQKRLTKGKNS